MSSLAKLARFLRVRPTTSLVVGVQRNSKVWHSTVSFDGGNGDGKNGEGEESDNDLVTEKPNLQLQGVDPRKGWGFRGVHKAIICGKVGQAPVQKILRNGRTVTIFTVGTGGMFDQRIGGKDLPKPAQWHRIAVHNEPLGAYAVQQLVKNSSVYVEGDIEVRVYNDSINGEVKHVPEICIRRDGRIRLIKTGESISNISVDELLHVLCGRRKLILGNLVSPCRQFEKVEAEGGCIDTLCCSFLKDSAMTSHRIRVRVGGCTAYTSVVDFNPDWTVESWNYGIELQWVPPN